MEVEINHYFVLGFGEDGTKLSDTDIGKAYRSKALELHPDKRPNDPNAHEEFRRLKSSFEILKDEKARKLFDDLLRVKREQLQRQSQFNVKRRRMMSDLKEKEHTTSKAQEEEERIARKLKEEIARIRAMQFSKPTTTTTTSSTTTSESKRKGDGLDEKKVLKVSWKGQNYEDYYNAQRLREFFTKFGDVEDVVVIRSKKRKNFCGSALVVMMDSKDAAAAVSAMKGGVYDGHLSNRLFVHPLRKTASTDQFSRVSPARKYEEHIDEHRLNSLVGAGYQANEDSILQKLLTKAAEKQN